MRSTRDTHQTVHVLASNYLGIGDTEKKSSKIEYRLRPRPPRPVGKWGFGAIDSSATTDSICQWCTCTWYSNLALLPVRARSGRQAQLPCSTHRGQLRDQACNDLNPGHATGRRLR